ncbi:MAG TPA: hypothetical protein VLK28_15925 [Methylomirabilota bacterium]|nr:hypothetical protein [Methylomirabilota bacterium]
MLTRRLGLALGIATALGLGPGPAQAQWQYTDGGGATKVVQYKLYVPPDYRDAAVWIGPTGIGRPGLSEAQRQARQREEAYRRMGEAQLRRLGIPCSSLIYAPAADGCRGASQ